MTTKTRPREPDLTDFMTTKEVAEKYGVTQVEVQKAIKRGHLDAQKIGYFYVLWSHKLPENFPTA